MITIAYTLNNLRTQVMKYQPDKFPEVFRALNEIVTAIGVTGVCVGIDGTTVLHMERTNTGWRQCESGPI